MVKAFKITFIQMATPGCLANFLHQIVFSKTVCSILIVLSMKFASNLNEGLMLSKTFDNFLSYSSFGHKAKWTAASYTAFAKLHLIQAIIINKLKKLCLKAIGLSYLYITCLKTYSCGQHSCMRSESLENTLLMDKSSIVRKKLIFWKGSICSHVLGKWNGWFSPKTCVGSRHQNCHLFADYFFTNRSNLFMDCIFSA